MRAQEESGMRKTEEQEDFLRIIRKLPPELGEVVFLRFSQELRLREIAETVGITPSDCPVQASAGAGTAEDRDGTGGRSRGRREQIK